MKTKCLRCGKEFEFKYLIKGIVVEMYEIATFCPYCNQELMIRIIPEKEVKIKERCDYIG